MVTLIAQGRGVKAERVKEWIDHGVFMAEDAKESGIIDAVEQRQDFEAFLRKTHGKNLDLAFKYGKKKGLTVDLSSFAGILSFYAQLLQPPRRARSDKDAVAIVYLEGPIMQGTKSSGLFATEGAYSTTIRKHLDQVAEDDSIKAVVFRVNSPGGSAVASEIILDATRRVAAKKPFVVSMGNVAGSGGYYVACGTKTIFADASTITGSIGVVAGKFATTEMWNKIGVNWKPYQRGKNAGIMGTADVFNPSERAALQEYMDKVYDVFKKNVTDIRGDRLKKPIDDLAGGRVYTGRQALALGLVDKIGGLTDAIAFAAKEARLEDYDVRVVPRPKNVLEQMLSSFGLDENSEKNDRLTLRVPDTPIELWKQALPHLQGLEPHRARAVLEALHMMGLAQRERVMLTMPVWRISN
jgi:protease-4